MIQLGSNLLVWYLPKWLVVETPFQQIVLYNIDCEWLAASKQKTSFVSGEAPVKKHVVATAAVRRLLIWKVPAG